MKTNSSFNFDKRIILGILFVCLGCLFLLETLGLLSFGITNVVFSLPMLAIILGIFNLSKKGNNVFGFLLIGGGILFIIPKIFVVNINFTAEHLFWPFILVAIGITILFQSKNKSGHHHHPWHDSWKDCDEKYKKDYEEKYKKKIEDKYNAEYEEKYKYYRNRWYKKEETSADIIDEVNVFSGCERKMTTKSFKGGKITSIFGGASYDFRDCELAEGKNIIDIVNLFGGTKLIFPSHWKVHVEVVAIFGGFADKRLNITVDTNSTSELHIVGTVIFGGGEIKSF